jgi:hypothetical protein
MYTADRLYDALMLDVWPSAGAMVDFGLDGANQQEVYSAYQRKVRRGEVSLAQLRNAVGDGPALTALIGVTVKTAYDSIVLSDLSDEYF